MLDRETRGGTIAQGRAHSQSPIPTDDESVRAIVECGTAFTGWKTSFLQVALQLGNFIFVTIAAIAGPSHVRFNACQ